MRHEYKLNRCITSKEARCKCGRCDQEAMSIGFLMASEKFSEVLSEINGKHFAIRWTSLNRCIPHNDEEGGVKDSDHLDGNGGDCKPWYGFNNRITKEVFLSVARRFFGYVKQYPDGRLHCSYRYRKELELKIIEPVSEDTEKEN